MKMIHRLSLLDVLEMGHLIDLLLRAMSNIKLVSDCLIDDSYVLSPQYQQQVLIAP